MRYILCLLVFSGFIFSGCKKDKDTTSIPRLKRSITVVLPVPLEIDTAVYTYNASGNVAEITHTLGKGKEVFTYNGSMVTWTYLNSAGAVASTSVYYLNSAGLADSLYYDSGNNTYSYKYDASGFKAEEKEYSSTGDLYAANTYVNDSKNTTTLYRQFPGNPVSVSTYSYDLQHNNTLDNANKGQSFLGKFSTNAQKVSSVTNSYDTQGRIVRTYWVSGADVLSNYYEYY